MTAPDPTAEHIDAVAPFGCAHSSLSGIDTTPLDDPGKLWRCHECDEVLDQEGTPVPDADAYLNILTDLRRPTTTPRPWADGTQATAEQMAAWLVACTDPERLAVVERMLQASDEAGRCFREDHVGRLGQPAALAASLPAEVMLAALVDRGALTEESAPISQHCGEWFPRWSGDHEAEGRRLVTRWEVAP